MAGDLNFDGLAARGIGHQRFELWTGARRDLRAVGFKVEREADRLGWLCRQRCGEEFIGFPLPSEIFAPVCRRCRRSRR
jgi:hypothetical protein